MRITNKILEAIKETCIGEYAALVIVSRPCFKALLNEGAKKHNKENICHIIGNDGEPVSIWSEHWIEYRKDFKDNEFKIRDCRIEVEDKTFTLSAHDMLYILSMQNGGSDAVQKERDEGYHGGGERPNP